MTIFRVWVSAMLLAVAAPAWAQVPAGAAGAAGRTGVIRGQVRTAPDQPVAAASVTVRSARDSALVTGALTTAEGRFRLVGLQPGRYLVRVSQLGYRPLPLPAVTITAAAAEVDLGVLRLEAAPVELKGIEVTAAASQVVMTADRTAYRTKDMPAATTGKAVDVLRTIPELEVDVNGKVTMRGNASVAIHLNDRPAPMRGEALTTFLQQLPGNTIERVEVVPNPSAKYDPEGLGGIVNIVLKSNVNLGLSGSLTGNASTRGQSGLNSRLAYQMGRITFFGGAGVTFYQMRQTSHDLRENLLARPLTYLDLSMATNYGQTFAMGDGTLEYKLGKKTTAWLSGNGYPGRSANTGTLGYIWLDSAQSPTQRSLRATDNSTDGWSANAVMGIRHQMVPQRHELSVEMRRNARHNDGTGRFLEQPLTLDGDSIELPALTVNLAGTEFREWVGQADYTRPLGPKGKIDMGVQGNRRKEDNDNVLQAFAQGEVLGATSSTATGYSLDETLGSAYANASLPLRKLQLQAGVRGEKAQTAFHVRRTGQEFPNDYSSIFPSAAALYDFGKNRRARVSYAKRLDRPYAYYLNPDVPVTDPLNRYAGNPALKPRYTHSISADFSMTKSEVTWRLAPFFRRTVNDWDNLKTVDSAGVSTVTWANIRTANTAGASMTTSLRQTGRLGGMTSLSLYSTRYDAPDLSAAYSQRHVYLSASGNASVKVNKSLDGQLMLMYSPPRDLPQGRVSSIVYSSVGLRQKFGTRGSANLNILDPLALYKYTLTTSDRTHVQSSSSSVRLRSVSLSLTYSFGKPPQSARKTGGQEEQQPQQPQQDRPIR